LQGSGSRPCKGVTRVLQNAGAVGRRLALALGFGLISLFFSEFFFLNEAPVLAVLEGENHVAFFLEFTLYYALFAYLALVVMGSGGRQDAVGLILGGATLGWAIEALVIPLAYEAPPLSFAWPSLGWHLVVVFGLGWVALGRMRRRWPAAWQGLAYLALGVIWTGWARLFWVEDPELVLPDVGGFAVYTVVTTALYGIGAWIVDRPGLHMTATGGDRIAAAAMAVPLFAMMGWSVWPWALALGGLWGLTLLALRRSPRVAPDAGDPAPPAGAYLASLALPIGAAVSFALLPDAPAGLSFLVILPLTALGTGALVWALWRGLMR